MDHDLFILFSCSIPCFLTVCSSRGESTDDKIHFCGPLIPLRHSFMVFLCVHQGDRLIGWNMDLGTSTITKKSVDADTVPWVHSNTT